MKDPFTKTRLDTSLGSPRTKQKETFDWRCAQVNFGQADTRKDVHVSLRKLHWPQLRLD